MNLKMFGYLKSPPCLEKIFRFDHCRCLEKQLLKLLGVKPPFLIDPLPFRNLPPFWIKFFTHPFQCIFKFLNPLFNKKGG